jgi:Chlamydia-phage Chp2 scaffold (Chlamy_scaf).
MNPLIQQLPKEPEPVFLRTAHNYDRDAASHNCSVTCPPEEDMTQQQFAEEVDINTIVRRFGLDGTMPETLDMPVTGDFTTVVDFQTAMQLTTQADQAFMTLPAPMRKRFNHNPGELMAFLDDDTNRDEAIALGLVNKPKKNT